MCRHTISPEHCLTIRILQICYTKKAIVNVYMIGQNYVDFASEKNESIVHWSEKVIILTNQSIKTLYVT